MVQKLSRAYLYQAFIKNWSSASVTLAAVECCHLMLYKYGKCTRQLKQENW